MSSKKDSYWFRHDSSAGRGLKLRKIAFLHGHWGKGIYWDVVEILRDAENYSYSSDEFDLRMLADLIGCKDTDKFLEWYKDCIKFELLEEDNNMFFSPALNKVMDVWETKKENGKKGGRPKKIKTELKPKLNLKETELKANQNHNRTEHNITIKENKIKEILKRFAETNYQQNEIIFKTNKNELTNHLKRFLEIKKDSEEFTNKPYGNVISWFWNWCNSTSKPKETNNNNTAAPWIEGSK
jgi:hypothetical protein